MHHEKDKGAVDSAKLHRQWLTACIFICISKCLILQVRKATFAISLGCDVVNDFQSFRQIPSALLFNVFKLSFVYLNCHLLDHVDLS